MSILHVKGGRGGGVPADRTPFWGTRTPDQIKKMMKLLNQLDKQWFRQILQVIVASMEGKEIEPSVLEKLQSENVTEEIITIVYSGLHILLKAAMRIPKASLKQEVFKEDLTGFKIQEPFITDLTSAVFGARRGIIDKYSLESRPRLPRLHNFRWRVDVAISTSVLNRALEPCIIMEMILSDGKVQSFEVPISKFHQLRYNVAYVLKEMEDLEKRNILKIQD